MLRRMRQLDSSLAWAPVCSLHSLGNGWVVDGEFAERSNWLRYINYSRKKANCVGGPLVLNGLTYGIYFRTCRPIEPEEE